MKSTLKKPSKQKLPYGWTQERLRKLAEHHDNMSEDEQAAEIEAAIAKAGQTMMLVPTELVPEIEKLIARKRTA